MALIVTVKYIVLTGGEIISLWVVCCLASQLLCASVPAAECYCYNMQSRCARTISLMRASDRRAVLSFRNCLFSFCSTYYDDRLRLTAFLQCDLRHYRFDLFFQEYSVQITFRQTWNDDRLKYRNRLSHGDMACELLQAAVNSTVHHIILD